MLESLSRSPNPDAAFDGFATQICGIRIPLPRDVSARISMKDAAKRETVIRIAGFCESSTFPTCYTGFDFNPGTFDRVATLIYNEKRFRRCLGRKGNNFFPGSQSDFGAALVVFANIQKHWSWRAISVRKVLMDGVRKQQKALCKVGYSGFWISDHIGTVSELRRRTQLTLLLVFGALW